MSPDNLISASRTQGFTPSELYAVRSIWAIRDCWRFLVFRSVLISFGVIPEFRSSSSGATTIADNGHRPIHLFASNPTWMTATSPALRTRGRRGLVDVFVPAPPDFGVLEDVQDHKAVVEEKLVSIHDSVLYRFIVVGYHQLFWSRGSAKPCGRRA